MTSVNNLYGIRVNTIMNNGSINFGQNSHAYHYVNMKVNAGFMQTGDVNQSPVKFSSVNNVFDRPGQKKKEKQASKTR